MKRLTLLAIGILLSSTASAFTLNSSTNPNLKGWDGADVQIMVNTTNCPAGVDVVALVNDAITVWNNVPTSKIKVSYGGTTTSTGTMTNPPTVYCETSFASMPGVDQNYVPGAASVNGSSGTITAGRIFLNATGGQANIKNFSNTVNVITMAHEIGHLLGLGHSHSTFALMYYDGSYKTTLSLSQDDIDGMSYLYPSDEFASSKYAGCGTVKMLPPGGSGPSAMWALMMLLPLIAYAVLRRPRISFGV